MIKIPSGNYTFIHYGYHGEPHEPQLALLPENAEQFIYLKPRAQYITLEFDKTKRHCTGWHDLATSESHPCPDQAIVPAEYEQCRHCQIKTGFNPAFYNAQTVSEQQTARNLQPHSLYLVHFGPNIVKVGITWSGRGIARLLDQGARSGVMLKTFATANVARQYEAKAAALAGIAETIQAKVKHRLLQQPYNPAEARNELIKARNYVVQNTGLTPEDNAILHLDHHYLGDHTLSPNLISLHDKTIVSGTCLGMVGSTLIVEQDGLQYFFPLSKLRGYTVKISDQPIINEHQPQQISLL